MNRLVYPGFSGFMVLLLVLCQSMLIAGGNGVPVCGTDVLRDVIFKNDAAAMQLHRTMDAHISEIIAGKYSAIGQKNVKSAAPQVYQLPVVVHIVHEDGAENISNAQVMDGLLHLNQALKNEGAFKSPGGVDAGIELCLAQQDEFGRFTAGITRHRSPLTTVVMESQDGALKNIGRWDPKKYINIWIVKEIVSSSAGTGVSGYAYFPSSHGGNSDGIVVEAGYFGTTDDNSKVIVHETGHYFGLYHTFEGGCRNNDCLNDGDHVCDTPPDASTAFTQCSAPVNTCTTDSDDQSLNNPFRPASKGGLGDQNDMTMNFMDYGDARCQTAFTRGQAERMRTFIETTRKSLLQSRGCETVCTAVIKPNISPDYMGVLVGSSVVFTNTTTGATQYLWDVDGQIVANTKNYTFTPLFKGTYRVRMTALNDDIACTKDTTAIIEAVCPVKASFTASRRSVLPGDQINFVNTSSAATSIRWLLDGVPQNTQSAYAPIFSSPGTFYVGLIAESTTCSDTTYMAIRVGNCVSKRGNVWHFGIGAGLDFTNDMPVEISSPMDKESWEGCSSICDTNGRLLFSTNGKTVWARDGGVMQNGTGLFGRASAAQSSLIVPVPQNDSLYYILTVDAWEATPDSLSKGLRYSLVNMKLNNGKGAIVPAQKNILLHTPTTEQLGGVVHCNGNDIWVMAHDWGSNKFLAFLVTKNGISSTPVVSGVGMEYKYNPKLQFPLDEAISTLKFSHNGKKLVTGLYHRNIAQLFDFDNSTGRVSSPISLNIPNAYGLEFSPNQSKLYVSSFDDRNIYQVDLLRPYPADAIVKIWSEKTGSNTGGSLQLAPNGKIYYAGGRGFSGKPSTLKKIGVINSPDKAGMDCNYNDQGILLKMGTNYSGLPNFVQSIMFDGAPSIYGLNSICLGSGEIQYSTNSLECSGETSFTWDFKGDIFVKQIVGNVASIEFTKTGVHQIIIRKSGRCGISADTLDVTVHPPKTIAFGEDVTLCLGSQYTLDAGAGFKEYLWQDGSRNQTFLVNQPGKYWVSAISEGGCIASDTIEIFFKNQNSVVELSNQDTVALCEGSVITFDAGPGFKTYRWQDGTDTRTYTAFRSGKYSVTASDFCGRSVRDSVVVSRSAKALNVASDNVTICQGESVEIAAETPYPVTWEPATGLSDPLSRNPIASPGATTVYTVTAVEPNGCLSVGTVTVRIAEKLPVAIAYSNITVEAGTRDVTIPIRCLANASLPLVLKKLVIETEFNPSIFQPLAVSKGTFGVFKKNGRSYIRIEAGDVTVSKPDENIIMLTADVLVGDSTLMPLEFSSVEVETGCVEVASRQNGMLAITGCSIEKRQTEFNEPIFMNIAPNPANDEVTISVFSIESGEHTVRIFDIQGKNVWEQSFKNDNSNTQTKLNVKVSQFAEGIYQVVLHTPTLSKSDVLRIVR